MACVARSAGRAGQAAATGRRVRARPVSDGETAFRRPGRNTRRRSSPSSAAQHASSAPAAHARRRRAVGDGDAQEPAAEAAPRRRREAARARWRRRRRRGRGGGAAPRRARQVRAARARERRWRISARTSAGRRLGGQLRRRHRVKPRSRACRSCRASAAQSSCHARDVRACHSGVSRPRARCGGLDTAGVMSRPTGRRGDGSTTGRDPRQENASGRGGGGSCPTSSSVEADASASLLREKRFLSRDMKIARGRSRSMNQRWAACNRRRRLMITSEFSRARARRSTSPRPPGEGSRGVEGATMSRHARNAPGAWGRRAYEAARLAQRRPSPSIRPSRASFSEQLPSRARHVAPSLAPSARPPVALHHSHLLVSHPPTPRAARGARSGRRGARGEGRSGDGVPGKAGRSAGVSPHRRRALALGTRFALGFAASATHRSSVRRTVRHQPRGGARAPHAPFRAGRARRAGRRRSPATACGPARQA